MDHYLNRLNYYQDSLKRFIQSDRPIMLIVGQAGSGKTKLIEQFYQSINATKQALKLNGNNDFTPSDIINQFQKHWDLSIDPEIESQRHQLDNLIQQLQKKRGPNLLIITNAHQLSIATLAAICHLEGVQQTLPVCLHIILVGEVCLEDKISSLLTSTPPSLLLQPLTQKETFQYIKNKLSKLNKSNLPIPSTKVLQKIYDHSGGFPSLINHLVQRWIYDQSLEKKHKPNLEKPNTQPQATKPSSPPNLAKPLPLKRIITATCVVLLGVGYLVYHHAHSTDMKNPQIAQLK